MFTFTPLLGAQADGAAVQSLLEFDGGVKILVDVGWDESFDADRLREIDKHVSTISLVLLTHPTFAHIGAYAHCCKHIPLFSRIPVYATTPIISLGRALLQDVYASTPLAAAVIPKSSLAELAYSFPALDSAHDPNILLAPPSSEEIGEYFNAINPLKYSQQHQPSAAPNSPPLDGLTVTAHAAGHSLGGTIWHIQHGSESVVYAVDWNQARENVLAGAAWLGAGVSAPGSEIIEQLRHPSALICSSKRCDVVGPEGGWKTRDDTLLAHIRTAINQGGTVLIPCDSSSRVLELAFLLEKAWAGDEALRAAPLFMASHTAGSVMRYAKSMLEWMDESVVREFESTAANRNADAQSRPGSAPFDFKHLRLMEKKSKVSRAIHASGAKVFLASDTSLEWGFSREILRSMTGDTKNLVIFPGTARGLPRQVSAPGDSLIQAFRRGLQEGDSVQQVDCVVNTQTVAVEALPDSEMPLYQQFLARQRERQTAVAVDRETAIEASADALDNRSDSSSSSEESDAELQGKALNTLASMASSNKQRIGITDEELGINILLKRKNVHDYDVRGKRGRERMFPYVAMRKRNDDFGDIIRPDEYLRAEERENIAAQETRNGAEGADANLGQKRKFDAGESGKSNASSKRRKTDKPSRGENGDRMDAQPTNRQGDDDGDSESDYEPEDSQLKGPRKAVFTPQEFHLKVSVVAVDYSGIHDQRSLQMLIPLIRPRKLVLTAGSADETASLRSECERMLSANVDAQKTSPTSEILAPGMLEVVDASVDTNAWSIKLSPALMRNLQWQQVQELGLVTISGKVEEAAIEGTAETSSKRQKTGKEEASARSEPSEAPSEDSSLVLSTLPTSVMATQRSFAQSVHVGDLRLAELRKLLQLEMHTAEFKGEGTLLVDGQITVRKSGIGRIEIDAGTRTPPWKRDSAFDMVRQRVYNGLAVVAAR